MKAVGVRIIAPLQLFRYSLRALDFVSSVLTVRSKK